MLTSTGRAHARKLALRAPSRALLAPKRAATNSSGEHKRAWAWGTQTGVPKQEESVFGLRKKESPASPAPSPSSRQRENVRPLEDMDSEERFGLAPRPDARQGPPSNLERPDAERSMHVASPYVHEGPAPVHDEDPGVRGAGQTSRPVPSSAAPGSYASSTPEGHDAAGSLGDSNHEFLGSRFRGQTVSYKSRPLTPSLADTAARPPPKPTLPVQWDIADDPHALGHRPNLGIPDASPFEVTGESPASSASTSSASRNWAGSSRSLPSRWDGDDPSLAALSAELSQFAESAPRFGPDKDQAEAQSVFHMKEKASMFGMKRAPPSLPNVPEDVGGHDESGFGLRRPGAELSAAGAAPAIVSHESKRLRLAPHTIVLRNLAPDTHRGTIIRMLRRVGQAPVKITMAMDKDKHFLGFAIVEFRAPSQAMEATFALNRQKSPLRELGSVALAEQKLAADLPLHLMHEEEDTRRVLWFGNLWYATTDDIFEEFLRQHHLPFTGFFIPRRDKKCFGHAQVEFETPEAARSALQQFAVHPPSLSGRRLIVDYSEKETLQRSAGGKEDEFVRASAPQEPSPTLFLAPVVSSVTPDDVARALGQLGAVPEWVKLTPIPGMENQCFVHAHFLSLDEARLVYDAAGRAKGDGFAPVVEVCGEEARVEYGQRMSRTHRSPRSPTLFIGNLQGLDITRQDINELVKTRLTPEAIGKEEVIRGIRILPHLGIVYVDLRGVELAEAVLSSHDVRPLSFRQRPLSLDFATPSDDYLKQHASQTSKEPTRFVHVGNLPTIGNTDSLRATLHSALLQLGPEPDYLTLVKDDNGLPQGYAIARYANDAQAEAVMDAARARHRGKPWLELADGMCRLDFGKAPLASTPSMPPTRTLFVDWLGDSGITPANIALRMSEVLGRTVVADVRMSADRAIAWVNLPTVSDAMEVMAKQPLEICGRSVRLDYAKASTRRASATEPADEGYERRPDTLFVGNLHNATDVDVRGALEQLTQSGDIVDLKFPSSIGTFSRARADVESLADLEHILRAHEARPLVTPSGTVLKLEFDATAHTTTAGLPVPRLIVRDLGRADDENAIRVTLDYAAGRSTTKRVEMHELPMYPHAHVQFQDAAAAERALKAHEERGTQLHGHALRLERAHLDKPAFAERARNARSGGGYIDLGTPSARTAPLDASAPAAPPPREVLSPLPLPPTPVYLGEAVRLPRGERDEQGFGGHGGRAPGPVRNETLGFGLRAARAPAASTRTPPASTRALPFPTESSSEPVEDETGFGLRSGAALRSGRLPEAGEGDVLRPEDEARMRKQPVRWDV